MMVLRWAKLKYGDVAEFTYEEIKSILGCLEDGTPLENVERLNEHARIRKHVYRPQFRYSWATGTTFVWEEIGERAEGLGTSVRATKEPSREAA
ncbi:MAG: hypothetical protein ACP6IT_10230 [Candidatus Thorarchaeota archaeon]